MSMKRVSDQALFASASLSHHRFHTLSRRRAFGFAPSSLTFGEGDMIGFRLRSELPLLYLRDRLGGWRSLGLPRPLGCVSHLFLHLSCSWLEHRGLLRRSLLLWLLHPDYICSWANFAPISACSCSCANSSMAPVVLEARV